ncbi:hypothetical protein A3E73_01265 [Candidatus Beckwithbacteria bacterium RIFCSPHIGHO2_12_FULL_47_17]|uniref:PD-(D/E)XK endonuclease-like domain-containing protein n=1 Tax=Candidatus Beckwithbacteria bacterium RIFCSPHIGHO2_12_FULL_47_17 TaxID=1797460 RepID=A0A1F5DK87_9BACT|nr:MAG: hypothetical protein A3E73_01265 [Candidatus Beckwithbacteria bacterium RIFCSPHIGHO2_12_FULL_47_17]
MAKDKFSAVWVSHSSISDWLACPRAYYLKNVYRDPKSRHKLTLMSPPLALGQIVHEVIEGLSTLAVARRFSEPLTLKFDRVWPKVARFFDENEAQKYKERGRQMLKNLMDHPGPLKNLAVKIKMDLPYFWLSEPDEIILCGRIDWLEYLAKEDAVHIIDFKTGRQDENDGSLQLPIYYLLATHTQERPVKKMSYWYLDHDNAPKSQSLPDPKKAAAKILKIAKEIKLARKLERFKCPHAGCRHCQPYEDILAGKAEFLDVDPKGYDLYIRKTEEGKKSEIL